MQQTATLIPLRTLAARLGITTSATYCRARKRNLLVCNAGGMYCVAEDAVPLLEFATPTSDATIESLAERRHTTIARELIWRQHLPALGDALYEITGVTLAEVLAPDRTPPTTHARWVLVNVLAHYGLSLNAIARLVNRDHSTVAHALATCDRKNTRSYLSRMSAASNRLAASVATATEEVVMQLAITGLYAPADDCPSFAVLDRTLATLDSDVQAPVSTYINGALLGRQRRFDGPHAAYGLRVLAEQAPVRLRVTAALQRGGLPQFVPSIQVAAQRCGYAWATS